MKSFINEAGNEVFLNELHPNTIANAHDKARDVVKNFNAPASKENFARYERKSNQVGRFAKKRQENYENGRMETRRPVAESMPSDKHFIKQQIEGHRKAAAKAKAAGDHHTAMAHEQQARDYEQHGMHGSKWETSSGLKYEEVNMDTVTEGAKKIKLTPGMKSKDFKAQKTAMKQKVVAKAKKAAATKKAAKKAAPSLPKVSATMAAAPEVEDDKMLARLLKGKLKHGDHPHLAKAIVSKIRTTHVKDRAEMQKKIYNAKGDELHSLIR